LSIFDNMFENPSSSPTPGPSDKPGPAGRTPRQARPDSAERVASSPEATHTRADRVSQLVGELRGLLESSMRSLGNVDRSLKAEDVLSHAGLTKAERCLSDAAAGLERMSELVHTAMQSKSHALGSPQLSKARPVTIGEAVEHAAEVCRPQADKHRITITTDLASSIARTPAGAIYTEVLNAVQNAVEAVARRSAGGEIHVELRPTTAPRHAAYGRDSRAWYTLEVRDDGIGLPAGTAAERVFDMGYSTKPHGAGVGLAVAKSIVQGMGGVIALRKADGAHGCVLSVQLPCLDLAAGVGEAA
jgi:signal transduction histidine kinase